MRAASASTYSFKQLDVSRGRDHTPADLLEAAQAEAEQIREQARAEGYATGCAQAQAEFSPAAERLTSALREAARALSATREELVEQLTRQAAEVALQIGRQIVQDAFEFQPELIVDVTRGAIRKLGDRHRLTVLVNPADLERVSGSLERLRAELGGIEYLDVQADRRIESGGALVRSHYGEIDATIATQIKNARAIVDAALIGEGAGGAAEAQAAAATVPTGDNDV